MQVMELTDNESNTRHLGHDFQVQESFDRIHSDASEMPKVGAALIVAEAGAVGRLRNRNLHSITLEDIASDPDLLNAEMGDDEFDLIEEQVTEVEDLNVPTTSRMKPPTHRMPSHLNVSLLLLLKSTDLLKALKKASGLQHPESHGKRKVKKLATTVRVPRRTVLDFFKSPIRRSQVSGKKACTDCIEQNTV